MSHRFAVVALLLMLVTPLAMAGDKEDERAQNAARVLSEIMAAPDKRVPAHLIEKAEAIAVIPDVVKAGLVLGGRRGKGLIAVRSPDGTWSNPS